MATATSSTTTNNNNTATSPEAFYFKQEQEETTMWSSSTPTTPSSVSSPPPSSSSSSNEQDYNIYRIPIGYDIVIVPLKQEEQEREYNQQQQQRLSFHENSLNSDSIAQDIIDASQSKIDYDNKGSSIVTNSSNSISKPVDIPKSRSSITTSSSQSTNVATSNNNNNNNNKDNNNAATTTSPVRLSAYRKRKADKNYIPRPKNCFMAYREHIKEKFLIENPGINNKVVSVLAANMWNNEPEDVKEHWRERAKQLKLEHKIKYPNYKFKPQKKKPSLKSSSSANNCQSNNVNKPNNNTNSNSSSNNNNNNNNNTSTNTKNTTNNSSITNSTTVTATTTNININNITTNIISNNSSNTTNTTTTNDTTSITNGRKKNVVDSKMIFADGFNNEIMCGDDNSNIKDDIKQKQPIYSLGLEGIATADDHEDIYLQHLQKKAIFGHYRSSSVDSLSSWTSDSTVSTPLLSPFAGSPTSLSPPTFQCNNSVGRSALRYEAGEISQSNIHNNHNNVNGNNHHPNLILSPQNLASSQTIYNEIDQLNQLYTRQIDVCSRGSLPVDDGFVLDSYNNQIIKSATVTDPSTTTATTYYQSSAMEMSATDYELMAMGHFTDSPIEEHGGFFHNYPNNNHNIYNHHHHHHQHNNYHNHNYSHQHHHHHHHHNGFNSPSSSSSSFDITSSTDSDSTASLADHYSYALEGPRRHSQQLLAEFEDGIKQQQIMLHGLLIDPNAQNHQ